MAWQSVFGAGKAVYTLLGATAAIAGVIGGYTQLDEHVCQKGRELPLGIPFPCDEHDPPRPPDPAIKPSGSSAAIAFAVDAQAAPQLEQPLRVALGRRLAATEPGAVNRVDIAVGPASFQGERRFRVMMNFALAGRGEPQTCSQTIDYSTSALFGERAAARVEEAIKSSNRKGTVACI